MIQCGALSSADWERGHALMMQVTEPTPMPINLALTDSFLDLLSGERSVNDMLTQQDSNEFLQFLLSQMEPHFIHCSWVPSAVHRGYELDERAGEKGGTHFPIRLNITGCDSPHPALQRLINDWFDAMGLRRCLRSRSPGLCFHIEQGSELGLCNTPIHDVTHNITVPVFDSVHSMIRFPTYCIQACAIHTIPFLTQGHYRAGLRTAQGWLLYYDGALPTKQLEWTMPPAYRIAAVWATLHEAHRSRIHH